MKVQFFAMWLGNLVDYRKVVTITIQVLIRTQPRIEKLKPNPPKQKLRSVLTTLSPIHVINESVPQLKILAKKSC